MSDSKVSAILINSQPYTREMLEADKTNGKISKQEYDRRKALFEPASSNSTVGTTVEKKANGAELTEAQKHNDGAKKAVDELGETARKSKRILEYQAILQELGKAIATGDKEQEAIRRQQLDDFKNENPDIDFTKSSDAARKDAAQFKKVTVTSGNGWSVDTHKNAENATIHNFHQDAPTEKVTVEKKKDVRKRIKENATYTDAKGIEHKGKADLKQVHKQMKADRKAAGKEFDAAVKAYRKSTGDSNVKVADMRLADAAAKMYEANTQYVLEDIAYKTAKGKGTRKRARAIVGNEKTDNKVADRTQVYNNKALADAAVKAHPELKGHVGVLPKDGGAVLSGLKTLAERHYKGEQTSLDKVFTDKDWEDLRNIKAPTSSDLSMNEADTRATQKALRALAGGDNILSPTEKKTLVKELNMGKKGNKITRTDLNKTFKAYGLTTENRFKNKVRDGLIEGAKAIPGAAISVTAARLNKAVSHALSITEATATATATKHIHEEVIASAIAHAEASVPGLNFTTIDPETGEEILKRIAGQFSEDTQEAVAKAIVDTDITAVATAQATARAEAHAEATPSWKKSLAGGAAIIGVAAAIGFLTSPGFERGVNKGQVSKEFKDIEFINLHKGSAARGSAAELIKERDKLAEKMGGNYSAANRALADAYRQYEGVQNGTMTQRELEKLRKDFGAFVDKYNDTPVEAPKAPAPKPKPDPSCDIDINKNVIEIKHHRRAGDTWGGIVNAYYPDCVKVHGERATIRALKEALATSEAGVRDEAKFKALLRGTDIPKLMKLPIELMDCEINRDGAVQARKFRTGGKSNNLEVGHGNTRYKAQDCDNRTYNGKTAAEVEAQVRKNNEGKKINIHVND